jgi:UDP-N-acetylglucosamine acyltransferase
MAIHPTSIVHPDAQIHPTATIGPFCTIGPYVRIGADTQLISHVVVSNHTTLGARNVVHPFASLGGAPQDLKYKGEPSRLVVGDDNVLRESTTLNIGTAAGHMETRVGNGCLLMAYAHVAHDCILEDGVILANSVGLAGHVVIGAQAILGGLSAIHQFCRIGRLAFVGGGTMVAQDVPPFVTAQGDRAAVAGLNSVGLRRAGWPRHDILALRRGLNLLFRATHTRQENLVELAKLSTAGGGHGVAALAELHAFVQAASRGICRARTGALGADES